MSQYLSTLEYVSCFEIGFSFQNNAKNLDPSCKMDLDFWDYFGVEKFCLVNTEIHVHVFYVCIIQDVYATQSDEPETETASVPDMVSEV